MRWMLHFSDAPQQLLGKVVTGVALRDVAEFLFSFLQQTRLSVEYSEDNVVVGICLAEIIEFVCHAIGMRRVVRRGRFAALVA